MRIDDEFNTLIEWGEEENQPDFVEFVKLVREAYTEKKPVVVEQNGVETEMVISPGFHFKKPFPDFDFYFLYYTDDKKKKLATVSWHYTYMYMIKKIGENKFHITAEESPEGTVLFK